MGWLVRNTPRSGFVQQAAAADVRRHKELFTPVSMNYESARQSLEQDGFGWERIRDYLLFGDIALREGNYQRLVQAAPAAIRNPGKQQLLLALLDAQACVFTEQVWVANEMAEKTGVPKPFSVEAHFSTAWLQINSNLRFENSLQPRDARAAMLKLQTPETLAARIVRPSGSTESGA